MQGALAGKMGLEKLHLIAQHPAALQIHIFSMGGCKRYRQQLHASLLRRPTRLVVVTALARGHHIAPGILTALTYRLNVITREIGVEKMKAAVETEVVVATE
jgi:hypothetical protein